LPLPDQALTPDTVLDISHESLIRNWQILGHLFLAPIKGAGRIREVCDALRR